MLLSNIFSGSVFSYLSLFSAPQTPLPSSPAHAWIKTFASIGDSYAAGLGAGARTDYACSRYSASYASVLTSSSSRLGVDPNRTDTFLACSGATTTEVLEKQVPALPRDIDVLTVSGGGNDVGLSVLLNQCIYQFFMAVDEDCEMAMLDVWRNIRDPDQLYANVTRLLEAVKPNMAQEHGVVYVTGYARFFGEQDSLCDNVTWAVWSNVEYSSSQQFLTLQRRKELNFMVRAVNSVISTAVTDAGPNFHFVDYDLLVEQHKGRYCEAGITEPNPNRKALYFYEWKTVDTGENATALSLPGDPVPAGSFEASIAIQVNKTLQDHPDWQFDEDKGPIYKNSAELDGQGMIGDTIHWFLPDYWKRVFHLRPEAHAIIARLIFEDLEGRGPGVREL